MAREYWVHHLNDLSGSPLILMELLRKKTNKNEVTLITNQGVGFLSPWNGSKVVISYTKYNRKILRFISLSIWYIKTAYFLLLKLRPGDHLVLSTLISSPLLIIQKLRSDISAEIRVNEVSFRVPLWRSVGLSLLNSEIVKKVYLSCFVRNSWRFAGPEQIEYPSLRFEFIQLSDSVSKIAAKDVGRLRFFLVCSYIEAKGYRLFIAIARHFERVNSNHQFCLYLSGDQEKFQNEFGAPGLPENFRVEFNNSSPEIFCGHDVFLGLTNPEMWVETFGQTFAEAMLMGNIVIVPPVGAQLEYVVDGENGLVFQDYSLDGVLAQIERLVKHPNPLEIANNAKTSMLKFFNIS